MRAKLTEDTCARRSETPNIFKNRMRTMDLSNSISDYANTVLLGFIIIYAGCAGGGRKKEGQGFQLVIGVIFFRLCCIKTINLYRLLLYHQFVFVGVKILSKSLDRLIKKASV